MNIKWNYKIKKLDDIIPWSKNPRILTKSGMADLKKSITKFGLPEPIVINTDGTIIGGHARYQTLKKSNITESICAIPERQLDSKELEELNIRLNKNIAGEFDFDMLANEFELDDLLEWGFSEDELQIDLSDDDEKDNQIPEPPEIPISKLGDIYQLGNHRLMCGDSTVKADVEKLMDGKKCDMVFTDPPYGVSYADKNTFLNNQDKGNHIQKEIINDHMTIEETQELWKGAFSLWAEFHNDYSSYYIASPAGELFLPMLNAMQEGKHPMKHTIIWAKNNHVLGRTDYNYKHEPLLYGWQHKHKFYGYGDQKFSVWNYDKPVKNDLHPTMKPVELIVNAILNSTERNMLVADYFLGSGSTLIACEKTNRICYGMELDPVYCDVIVKRWEDYTGNKAVKL